MRGKARNPSLPILYTGDPSEGLRGSDVLSVTLCFYGTPLLKKRSGGTMALTLTEKPQGDPPDPAVVQFDGIHEP